MSTRLNALVGCRVPIQLAAMPGVSNVELAAAVANAGGLGMISGVLASPEQLIPEVEKLCAATEGAFGVSFLMPFLTTHEVVAVAAEHAPVVEFFYDTPDPVLVRMVHERGALCAWQVGSASEAQTAEAAGCDFIIAQGSEAGGHVRGTQSLAQVLREVRAAVRIPVVAAGGIATADDVRRTFAAGADGVRVGTRFAAAVESGAHPTYVEALLRARSEDTVITTAFHVMWPNAPHRVLKSCIAAAEAFEGEQVGETERLGRTLEVARFSVVGPTKETTGSIEAMALYAGTSVGSVTKREPAAAVIADLAAGIP